MFENHYNSETHTNEAEYVPAEMHEPEKKKKSKTGKTVKLIAAICCIAGLSAGSIAGYRYFNGNDSKSVFSFFSKSDKKEDESKTLSKENAEELSDITEKSTISADYEAKSLSQLSKSENALSTQEIYKKCLPSVVGITSTFEYTEQNQYSFFGYSFDDGSASRRSAAAGGTGIVMSEDGYIITNAHVIYQKKYGGKAVKISILLSDESEFEAQIVGYDEQADVAILKADTKENKLTPAEFGDSDAVRIGDYAIAIGNPLTFDLFGTLTVGYISGVNREISVNEQAIPLIQTDAAINSGNSGGPLINDCGQVIGINSSKMSRSFSSSSASIEGLGFAIPINEAREIVDELINYDSTKESIKKIQIGITCRDISAASSQYYADDANADVFGVLVTDMIENGPAARAGLQIDDVIVGADGESIQTIAQLNKIKAKFKAGETLELTIIRDRKYYKISIVLEEMEVANDEPATSSDENAQETVPQQDTPEITPDREIIPQLPGGDFSQWGFDPFEDFWGR